MKGLIWGDWQLESRPSSDRLDDEGRSIRFAENRQALLDTLHAAKEAGCTFMVHLGDLTEERDPDSATLTAAAEVFGLALKWGWEVHAIAGNHDGAIFSLSSSSFEALGKIHEKFHVYHKAEQVSIGGVKCMFLPYLHRQDLDQIKMWVASAAPDSDPSSSKFLFAHYAYAGVQIGAKNMILPGDHLDDSILRISGAKTAFFGHIHKQQVIEATGGAKVIFPGSPYCCDFGEREDPKGYAILDLDDGKWELKQVPSMRRWLYVDWKALGTPKGRYEPEDLVKITGEMGPGESPQDAFKALLASGKIKEPFFKVFEVRRAAQASKRGVVSAESGLQQALADFFAYRFPDDPLAKPALVAASDALKASSPTPYDKSIVLKEVHMVDFLSHSEAQVKFVAGEPLLVCGENGLGKTNLIEAVLFALTGQVSKGLKMASMVRQGATKASVDLLLQGEQGEYRIRRTISLSSKGAATHKVDVERMSNGAKWVSLADGGVADTQAALGRLIGATFLSMRAINFQFQRDPNPFIGADPAERKAILAEILGLEALGRALKVLDEDRKIKMRAKDAAESVATEAAERYDAKEVARLEGELKGAEDRAPGLGKDLTAAKAVTEAAVAEAGAVGSERNTLQTVIDALDGQAGGADDLKKSKDDQTAAYNTSRADLIKSFRAARDRAVEKQKEADGLPAANDALAEAETENARLAGPVDFLTELGLKANIDRLTQDSAQKAKISVDARLAEREANNRKSDAGYALDTLLNERSKLSKDLASMKSQDLKECSKCHRPIDSTEAEKHIAELEADVAAFAPRILEAEAAKLEAVEAHKTSAQAEKTTSSTAEAAAKALTDATSAADRAIDAKKAAAKAAVSDAKAKVASASTAASDAAQATKERDEHEANGAKATAAHDKAMADIDARIAEAEKRAVDAKAKADDARTKLTGIDARLKDKQKAVEDAKLAEKDRQDSVDACAAEIASIGAAIMSQKDNEANAFAKAAALDEAKRTWETADKACVGMKELPAHLIDEKLPVLADLVNSYLVEFGSPEFAIAFSTRKDDGKETMDVLVDNGAEPRLDVTAYSGGQLDRIEFCLRLALGDMAEAMRDVRLGFSMMDEPGTHLDEEKKGALMRLVKARAADGRCPIAVIVSHDRKMMGAFDRKLTVTRDGMRMG